MNIAELIHGSAYLAIACGTFFEGEVVMLAAGVAAASGLLSLPLIIASGMAGIFASDTLCFLIGRFAGDKLAAWFPKTHARLDGVFKLIQHHDQKVIMFFQFVPGACTVTPVAFGMTRMPIARFLAFDAVGNAIWTLCFALGGYGCGATIGRFFTTMPAWEAIGLGLAGLAIAGGLLWQIRRIAAKMLRAPVISSYPEDSVYPVARGDEVEAA